VAALNGQSAGLQRNSPAAAGKLRCAAGKSSLEHRTSKHVLPGPAGQAYACAAAIGVILKGIVYDPS